MDGSKKTHQDGGFDNGLLRSDGERSFLKKRLERSRMRQTQSPTIPRVARDQPLALSFAQQRIWFLQELAPGNTFYNIPAAVPLNGPFDRAALESALNGIVARHESLRTVYRRIDGQTRQIICPHQHTPLELLDISSHGVTESEQQLNYISTQEAQTPFDLGAGPLIRFRLVRRSMNRHVLLITVHHIAADGWSMGILFRELGELYEAAKTGRAPELPTLPLQYGDFAEWQRDRLSGPALDQLLGYWGGQMKGAQNLSLLTDRPRPAIATFRGDFLEVNIDRQTTEAMRKLARAQDCTLFQAMLAAFKAVLSRFAGTFDVLVGAPIANRSHPDLEPLIGFFVNSLALRTDFSGDPSFTEILARVRETTLEAYAHQDLPFERLVEDIRPDRDLSRNPLFQVSFQIQNAPGVSDKPKVGGQDFRRIERSSAILDLAMSFWETPQGLVGGVEYSTDIFDRDSIQRISDALTLVMRAVSTDPTIRLSHLPMMGVGAGQKFARLLRGPVTSVKHRTMDRLFAQTVAQFPQHTALIDGTGEVSFAALDDASSRVAQAFRAAGLVRGDCVGLAIDRSRNFTICMLALVKIGAKYLPIDPNAPAGRMETMAEVVSPKIVITQDDSPTYPFGASGKIGELLDHAASCGPFENDVDLQPTDGCYILFTSGSTGRPKAVEVSHGALANHMQWMRGAFNVVSEDRILQRTPTHFDASIWEFWLPLVSGARLCLPPVFHAADGAALLTAIKDLQPTIIQFVPSLLPILFAEGDLANISNSVRVLCCGGEKLTARLADQIKERFTAAQIINLYGPTETTIDATWHQIQADNVEPVPIGRPIQNCTALVVDEHGVLCPPNMRGEIAISGAPLATGYFGQDALTAERFVQIPGQKGRVFLTGDMGWYTSDGTLYSSGRRDRQVKLRGNRIELGEIESVLKQHDLVQHAAVVLHEEGDVPALAAFLTFRDDVCAGPLCQEIESELVENWEGLYRVVYAGDEETAENALDDFTGWISSFDAQPIPLDEMRRWAAETAARINALNPSGIFEIGCGSGLILSRLAAPDVAYVGCDLSSAVIDRLQVWVDQNTSSAVNLYVSAALAAGEIPIEGCDTLVLNSVVQYLPSANHLRDVLTINSARLPANARVFMGDIRPLGLLRAFHCAAEIARTSSGVRIDEMRKRVEAACAQEKELLFDPEYFRQLACNEPSLHGDVAIRLKDGSDDNELCTYRYDVSLRRGQVLPDAPLNWHQWRLGEIDSQFLLKVIESYEKPIAIAGIPNLRVATAVELSHLLPEMDAEASCDDLLAEAKDIACEGVNPGEIAKICVAKGLRAELLPNRDHPDRFDLVVHDGSLSGFSIDAAQKGNGPSSRALSSEPTLRALTARLGPELRAYLSERLPAVMCPTRLRLLDQMPMLSNGKLDYGALAFQVPHVPARETQYETPADALEQLIADVFATVLGVTQVGAGDHFFAALGGHSVLATQAVARLREIFGDDVPLRLLFEYPTPREFAAQMIKKDPEARNIAEQYATTRDLDEASLDALLADMEGATDE